MAGPVNSGNNGWSTFLIMLEWSKAERNLIEFAREEFGEFLTQFLLAGLGEEETAQSWLFTVEFYEGGTTRQRNLQVSVNDQPDVLVHLPQQREPLVILALLWLFILRDQTSSASLSYYMEDVLGLLDWEENARSRHIIDEAVARYSNLIYQWKMSDDELARRNLTFFNSKEYFISGYASLQDVIVDSGLRQRVINRVDFSLHFIERLRRRSLFEINWNSVSSLTRVDRS
jgi:hypothetical protein